MKITKPTAFVDRARVLANIELMNKKARQSQVLFRPHFKTHRSATIGMWFRKFNIHAITVSSLEMANYFAGHGWEDITVAFLVHPGQIEEINRLAKKITLNLLVDSFEAIDFLEERVTANVNLWVKVDTGYHRTGIAWDNESFLSKLIRRIKKTKNLHFEGLLTHSGHTYHAKTREEIKEIYEDTLFKLKDIQERLFLQGFSVVKLSIGNTPACSLLEDFSGVDEIRPGNFVFYDAMQLQLGSCTEEQIAFAIACPIVGVYPQRNELVIHGGAVHLSKESLEGFFNKEKSYGLIALAKENGWGSIIQNAYVSKLSQEHGIITGPKEFIKQRRIGELLYIIPVHSCLAANLMKRYFTLEFEPLLVAP